MVKPGDDKGRIEKAKHSRKHTFKAGRQTCIYKIGNHGANLPPNRPQHAVGDDNRQQQGAEGHHDHGDDCRAYFPEEALQIYQGKAGQNRREHLGLIAYHLHLEEAEIPYRNIRRGRPGHPVSI